MYLIKESICEVNHVMVRFFDIEGDGAIHDKGNKAYTVDSTITDRQTDRHRRTNHEEKH